MSPNPVEFAPPRGWNVLFLMGSLLFVGAGLWLALRRESDAHARGAGLANVAFFGLCAWIFVREDVRPRPRLRLDASGLELCHPRPGASFRFEWRAIESVTVRPDERASLVVVTLRDASGRAEETVPDFMAARDFSPAMLASEFTLSPAELGTDADTLAADIDRFRRLYAPAPLPIRREDMM